MNQPSIETRRNNVFTKLHSMGIRPSFPPTNETNQSEGADGDCICPFADLHTHQEADPTKPTVRIWLDRVDGNRPELGGKVYLSCRHMSCQEALWESVTLPIRKMEAPTRTHQSNHTRPHTPMQPNPETALAQKRKLASAVAGKAFTETILNDPTTLAVSEADIMRLSPFPLLSKSGERPPLAQLALFLSLFHPDDLVYLGDVEDAKSTSHIRTRAQWDQWIDDFSRSATFGEDQQHWPWPGHYTSSATYKSAADGRNNLNALSRRFVVCESDKLGKKEQLRVIHQLIRDKRFPVAYVLFSGSKSYHIGLRIPEPSEIDLAFLSGIPGTQAPRELIKTRRPERFGGMGFDPATTRLVQPIRIPGPMHPRTGRLQRLLYIDPDMGYESIPTELMEAPQAPEAAE